VGRYLLRRLAASLLLLWLVVTVTFFLLHAAPGRPTELLGDFGSRALGAEQREQIERIYGLDRPLPEQYVRWLGATLRGDFGTSFDQRRPAATMVVEALPATLLLALAATLVEYALSVPLAVWAVRRRGSAVDSTVRSVSLVFFSLPEFWLGVMAILLFTYVWPILPSSGMSSPGTDLTGWARVADVARHLVLPATVLGVSAAGGSLRFLRNSLLDVMGQDYIRAARAKGLSERRVLTVHGLRNAAVPATQILALNLGALLNGALIVEVIFGWPGLGQVLILAIRTNDYPVVLAATTLSAVVVLATNFAADVAQAALDPRVRHR